MKQELLAECIRVVTKTLPLYFNMVLNSRGYRTYWQEYGLSFVIFFNEFYHLGCNVVQSCESQLTSRRNISPPSSGSKSKTSKRNQQEAGRKRKLNDAEFVKSSEYPSKFSRFKSVTLQNLDVI
jgi:hypothetical protein